MTLDSKQWGKNINFYSDILNKYFGTSEIKSLGKKFNSLDKNNDKVVSNEEFFISKNKKNTEVKKKLIDILKKRLN